MGMAVSHVSQVGEGGLLELFQSAELSAVETGRLAALEQTIERGLQTFVEVGTALLEIRDSRLYRQAFGGG